MSVDPDPTSAVAPPQQVDAIDGFALQTQAAPPVPPLATKAKPGSAAATPKPKGRPAADEATQVISYRHLDKRKNNPEVGMVTPATDPEAGKTRWAYDPHLDPALAFVDDRGIESLKVMNLEVR